MLRENPCFAGRFLAHEHCFGEKTAVNVYYAATPFQFACSGKTPVLRAVSLRMSIALGKKQQ